MHWDETGSIGPVGLSIPVIADRSVVNMADFVTGANRHWISLDWCQLGTDAQYNVVADVRDVVEGDPFARWQRKPADQTWHRGGWHLPVGYQIQ